ncbi:hypothetical protein H9651_06835 [Microbacterium sp. Sa4CUA7]|uniref:Uncharacterized protein n=1 Tax=Microbacterium pullorum TaxID=2762236 RepID=A0ABR8S1X0_9MICO|nr:hypothetical protein [Microbacterium pullorum]MBD7957349.1 hypothetical protein [Microbacterium pullorum]
MTDRATKSSPATGRARRAPARTAAPRRRARRAPKSRREVLTGRVFFWSGMGIVAFGMLPLLAVMVIGLAQGTVPVESGVLGTGAGYPLFQPPFWLLWLPALGMVALTVITWPFPARFPTYFWGARSDMSAISAVGLMTALTASVAFGGPQLWVVLGAGALFLLAMVVFGVRGSIEFIRDGIDLRAGRLPGERRR